VIRHSETFEDVGQVRCSLIRFWAFDPKERLVFSDAPLIDTDLPALQNFEPTHSPMKMPAERSLLFSVLRKSQTSVRSLLFATISEPLDSWAQKPKTTSFAAPRVQRKAEEAFEAGPKTRSPQHE
jgi:hypothetical protein